MNTFIRTKHHAALAMAICLTLLGALTTTARAGTLYITSATGNTVTTWDSVGGGVLSTLPVSGLNSPYGIATDGAGNLYTSGIGGATSKIGKYNLTTGVANPSFTPVPTAKNGIDIKVSGGIIYASRYTDGKVSAYNASTGATINETFFSTPAGLSPRALVLDGAGNLYIAYYNASGTTGRIGKYNASTGATINASFIGGLNGPCGLALDGAGNLFVASWNTNSISKFNASTGAAVNFTSTGTNSITQPVGSGACYVTVFEGNLYVTNYYTGTIGKYDTATGAGVSNFISGLNAPSGIMALSAAPDTVSISGMTSKVIRLPFGASAALIATANELRDKLNDITGTSSFTVDTAPNYYTAANGPSPGIVLGRGTDLNMASELPNPDPASGPNLPKRREDYQICTGNNNSYLFLVGTTDFAVQNAVYDFLNQLGCRWYFASAHWIITPDAPSLTWTTAPRLRTKTVTLGTQGSIAMKVYNDEKPDFKMRNYGFSYSGAGNPAGEWSQNYQDILEWKKGNRAQSAFYVNGTHNYGGKPPHGWGNWGIIGWANTQTPNQWSDNYWSYIGGSRLHNTQIGVSNWGNESGVHQMLQNYVTSYFASHPLEDTVSLDPNDGDGFCLCAGCQAIQPQTINANGTGSGSVTNRVVYFANKAADVLTGNLAGKYVAYNAYHTHAMPPVPGFDPNNPTAQIPMSFLPNPTKTYVLVVLANSGLLTPDYLVQQWSLLVSNMGLYDYQDVFFWSYNMLGGFGQATKSTRWAQILPPYYKNNHVDAINLEATNGWGPNGLGYYLGTNVLWKTTSDVTALKSDFLTKSFGNAVAPMTEFYNRIDGANPIRSPLSNDLLHRLYQNLTDAYAAETNPAVRDRINDLTLWVRYNELLLQFFGASATSSPSKQTCMQTLLTFTWKIRATNMVDSLAFWINAKAMLYSGFVWPKNGAGVDMDRYLTNAQGNTLKEMTVFSSGDIETMRSQGLTNNPLLPEEPKSFSTDVVPSSRPAAARGSFSYLVGKTIFYLYTDNNGDLPALTAAAGITIPKDAQWSLYRATDLSVVLASGIVAAGNAPIINLASYGSFGKGSYVFVYDDAGNSLVTWNAGLRISYASTSYEPLPIASTVTRRYFYVPKGTKNVMLHCGWFSAGIRFYDGSTPANQLTFTQGTLQNQTATSSGPGDIVIPVPNGKDDQVWYMAPLNSVNSFYFLNIPGYLATSPDELVIPREAYSNLKPANQSAVSEGLNGTVNGVTHFYVHTAGTGTTLPTLTVTNTLSGGATWKLHKEMDNLTASPTPTPVASGSINSGVAGGTITPTVTVAGCYHLAYNDNASVSSTFSWPAGSRVVVAATAAEPLPSLVTVANGRRYFYVPKGTTSIQVTASAVGSNGLVFCTNTGTTRLTQAASGSAVTMNVPVSSGEDGKIWTMRPNGSGNTINVTNLVFQNTPGYLAVDADQLLLPQWAANEAQNLW